jgi:glucosyl-dolichyl phosphate glucuronosyltransferase
VVICTHSLDAYSFLQEAIDSILSQTLQPGELIVAVDGNKELYSRIVADYKNRALVRPVLLEKNSGVSAARNAGIQAAGGDIIVFTDDDAAAEKDWLEKLLQTYISRDALSVGGKILPAWLARPPDYFPDELNWLVGATNIGFVEDRIMEVRNTYGGNMSFKREVFQKAGVFNSGFGFSGASHLQAEEPEMALRMKQVLGKGVIYNPAAIVYHKIHPSKAALRVIFKRSFFQGYSKALLRKLQTAANPMNMNMEKSYLRYLLKRILFRISRINHITEIKKGLVIIISVAGVGLGFVYGVIKVRRKSALK